MIRPLGISFLAAGLAAAAEPRADLLAPSNLFPGYGEHLITADIKGDGDLDLVHLPNGAAMDIHGDPHAYWIENRGNRQFAPPRLIHLAPTAANESLQLPALINLTGDASLEFFANRRFSDNYFHEPLALTPVFSGAANASNTALAAATSAPWRAVDLDADNQGELIQLKWIDPNTTAVRIFDRQHDGSFAESMAFETTVAISQDSPLLAIDLDGDGDLELGIDFPGGWAVFERIGPRTFAATPVVQNGIYGSPPWVDLDGDELPDALSGQGSWQKNLGGLTFAPPKISPAFTLTDFGAFRTIAERPGLPALVHGILPTGDDGWELVTIPFGASEPISRHMIPGNFANGVQFFRYEDLDGDGHADLLHSYAPDNSWHIAPPVLAVAWGSPAGLSAPQVISAASASPEVHAADFNRDKCTDLIVGPDALGLYRIHYNQGRAGLAEGLPLTGLDVPGTKLRILGVARIDKDKCPDLVCNYTRVPEGEAGPEHAIVVVRGRKDGSFMKPVIPASGLVFAPGPLMVGDFVDWDRDGDLDLVAAGQWRENVKGSFPSGQRQLVELGTTADFFGQPMTIGGTITGDLDGDRVPDIISLIYGEGGDGAGIFEQPPKKMLVAYNDGRGGIEATVELPVTLAAYDFAGNPIVPGTAAIADLDADKLPDLWIREVVGRDTADNPVIGVRWLKNPGRGSRDPRTWVSQALPNTVEPGGALADFDGDGKTEWVSPYGYLKPTKQGPLVSQPFDFTGDTNLSNQPFRAAVDIDADRDADFIIGGGGSPLMVLHNPSADERKGRSPKPRRIRWLPQPVVR